MTLPQNVKDAVGNVDACRLETFDADWLTIKDQLMSQEAEIEKLSRKANHLLIAADDHQDRANLAESRLAAANALLRECYEWLFESLSDGPRVSEGAIEKHYYTPLLEAFHARIQSHLQGAGDE